MRLVPVRPLPSSLAGIDIHRVIMADELGDGTPPFEVLVVTSPWVLAERAVPALLQLRREFPWAPVAVVIPDLPPTSIAAAAHLSKHLACRVIDTKFDSSLYRWAGTLANCINLPSESGGWLKVQRPRVRARCISQVEALVAAGLKGHSVADAAAKLGLSVGGLEMALRRAGLKTPTAYVRFGRLAPALLPYANGGGSSLERIAIKRGFHDASAFSRAVLREFAIRPSALRGRLSGWEWLACTAELHGVSRGRKQDELPEFRQRSILRFSRGVPEPRSGAIAILPGSR